MPNTQRFITTALILALGASLGFAQPAPQIPPPDPPSRTEVLNLLTTIEDKVNAVEVGVNQVKAEFREGDLYLIYSNINEIHTKVQGFRNRINKSGPVFNASTLHSLELSLSNLTDQLDRESGYYLLNHAADNGAVILVKFHNLSVTIKDANFSVYEAIGRYLELFFERCQ